MGTLTETSNFDSTVYEIETTDPVQGGPGGIANLPAQNLTNRSRWLYDQIRSILTAIGLLAPLASPSLTGSPTAPTQSAGDNSTKLATTAFSTTLARGIQVISLAGANVSLTAQQAGYSILVFEGTLTANVAVIFPAAGRWLVVNETTGNFTVTVKLATGAGVVIGQAKSRAVWSDGFNFFPEETEATTPAAGDVSTAPVTTAFLAGATRLRATSNVNLYVSPSGSDTANTGLSTGSPFATLQKAWDVLFAEYDMNGYTATINAANGTYSAGVVCHNLPPGCDAVNFVGNPTSPSSCVISASGTGVYCFNSSTSYINVNGFEIEASGSYAVGLSASYGGVLNFENIVFGTCTYAHIQQGASGSISSGGNPYTIVGGSNNHALCGFPGYMVLSDSAVTIVGNPNFSGAFAFATAGGVLDAVGMTFSGSCTGLNFTVNSNGVIQTNTGNYGFFPGTSQGTPSGGGQYT